MNNEFPANHALAELVTRARAVPSPTVNVTVADVAAEVRARSVARRWPVVAVFATAAAALVLFLGSTRADKADAAPCRPAVAAAQRTAVQDPARPFVNVPRNAGAAASGPSDEALEPPLVDHEPDVVRVARGITIATESGPEPVVVSTWRAEVAGGVYRIVVAADVESTFYVKHGQRTLDIEPDSSVTVNDGELTVAHGHARWHEEKSEASVPTASALAAQAERAITRGDRPAAILSLTTLARKHPRAAETRTGLVDLARLRAASGDPDRARCAYALALRRWPNASISTDIRHALKRLGDGTGCRGLRPR